MYTWLNWVLNLGGRQSILGLLYPSLVIWLGRNEGQYIIRYNYACLLPAARARELPTVALINNSPSRQAGTAIRMPQTIFILAALTPYSSLLALRKFTNE